jgi:ATP-dependent DNA helicase RecG
VRPNILNPLFASVTSLPGIGQRLAQLVEKLAGPLVIDVAGHLPNRLIDHATSRICRPPKRAVTTIVVRLMAHEIPQPAPAVQVRCSDPTASSTSCSSTRARIIC